LVEECIRKDVDRGQLKRGTSPWGAPAFVTKAPGRFKAIQRGRRLVVDYRGLNRVTVRKVFLIPNSDYIKSTVAGSDLISVGDLKEGFNQCDNTVEASQKMAVLAASGSYLPKGLTFGPTNGPEDFQELMFICFSKSLYRNWFLFLDDLAVATGGKPPVQASTEGIADHWCTMQESMGEGVEAGQSVQTVGKFDPRLPSPYAQIAEWGIIIMIMLTRGGGIGPTQAYRSLPYLYPYHLAQPPYPSLCC